MPPKNSVEFSPELLYIHDAGAPPPTWPPSIGKVNESRLDGLNHDCMIVDEVSCNGNFEKGEVIKAMRNNDILVKVGNKFYTPTNIEYEVSLGEPTNVKIDATLASYLEVTAKERTNPRAIKVEVTAKERTNPLAIKDVIFNDPATIVFWQDGTKTVVKTNHGDTFDPEKGLAMAISKKVLGNKYEYYGKFQKWIKKGLKKQGDTDGKRR